MRRSSHTPGTSWAQHRLRELLVSKRLTGAELARRLGEPPMWVSDRIRGHSTITADDIPRITQALGIDPCNFFHPQSISVPGQSPVVLGMEPDYIRASTFAREMAAAWPNLRPQERNLVEAVAQAAATAAANAVLAVLHQEQNERKNQKE